MQRPTGQTCVESERHGICGIHPYLNPRIVERGVGLYTGLFPRCTSFRNWEIGQMPLHAHCVVLLTYASDPDEHWDQHQVNTRAINDIETIDLNRHKVIS